MEQQRGRGRQRGRGSRPYRSTRIRATPNGVVEGTARKRRHVRPRRITVAENCSNQQVPPPENPMQSAPPPPTDAFSPVSPCCLENKGYSENYDNFLKSRLPRRILVYAINEWVDFPEIVTKALIKGFRDRKSANIVMISGSKYLVDFINMVLIRLESRTQKSIAWIDRANNCFFPKFVIDGGDQAKISVELITAQCSEIQDNVGDDDVPMVHSEPIVDMGSDPMVSNDLSMNFNFGSLLTHGLEEVDKSSEYFFDVQNSFLSGLGKLVDPGCILGVYRYNPVGFPALSERSAFQKQVKLTRMFRGQSNVRRAWFGASKHGIANIILHGFGASMNSSLDGISFDHCIHLSSEGNSYLSAKNCTVDENGNRYMLLCKVILGSMENIKPGSNHWHPSSDSFDSGVDNPVNPKTYVVWGTHMNLHIQPECVVNFCLPSTVRSDFLAGLNTNDDMDGAHLFTHQASVRIDYLVAFLQLPPEAMPFLPWISILKLFATARGSISPIRRDILDNQFHDFRCKKLNKDELLRKMKATVGDQLLTILKKMESMYSDINFQNELSKHH